MVWWMDIDVRFWNCAKVIYLILLSEKKGSDQIVVRHTARAKWGNTYHSSVPMTPSSSVFLVVLVENIPTFPVRLWPN